MFQKDDQLSVLRFSVSALLVFYAHVFGPSLQELCLVYGAMARFAGDNYVQLQAKLNSPEHLQLVAMLHANEEEEIYLGQMMKVNESDPTLRRRRRVSCGTLEWAGCWARWRAAGSSYSCYFF